MELTPSIVKLTETADWLEYLCQQKPNSKWSIGMFANAAICVYKIKDQPIGARDNALPQWLTYNRGVVALQKNPHTKQH